MAVLFGCQSSEVESEASAPTNASEQAAAPSGEKEAASSDDAITAGMEMADVKKIKGAPNSTAHEHGAGGAEIDIWKYDDGEVRFVNGVTE
jgi:hypothetical protein